MPKPIFIIGKQRTGTTWLANLLCEHSNVVGIQDQDGYGIYESLFFSHIIGISGNLHNENNFIHFMNIFSKSDYFIESGLNKEYFYQKKSQTYQDFFRLLMDRYAEKHGAKYWLEKSPDHSLYLNEILKHYPDVKFIVIKRNVVDTIKSIMQRSYFKARFKFVNIIKEVILYIEYYKNIEHFYKYHPNIVKVVMYEDLIKSITPMMRELCKFLDIEFEHQILTTKYKPRTSFKSNQQRKEILSTFEILFINNVYFFSNILPYQLFRLLHHFQNLYFKKQIPDWYFSIARMNIHSKYNNKRA